MEKVLKIAVVAAAVVVMLIPDVAYAQAGRMHRATRRRTAVVVGTTAHAAGSAQAAGAQQQAAASQQQAAASQQQTAAAQQQAAAAEQHAAAAEKEAAAAKQEAAAAEARAAAAGPLPLGTVVPSLPPGCPSKAIGGVEYYQCGGNSYRAAFQGNNLVYVTAQPN